MFSGKKGGLRLRSSLAVTLFFLLLSNTVLTARYHPAIKWREISGSRFIVVFPEGYEEDASYTLETAQRLYDELSRFWSGSFRIPGKIRLLLSDATDDANGAASFFPFNHIVIHLYTPPPDSTIGGSRDWIRFVLSHELTHLIHFNTGTGASYFLRRILGSNPVLYPSLLLPPWMVEGLSVYAESKLNEGGRLDSPDYRVMLERIAQSGRMPDWGDFWGAPTAWPGPASRYFYGGMFIGFLAENYGEAHIPELIKVFGYYPLPFFRAGGKALPVTLHQRFKRVFGKDLNVLWDEFVDHLPAAGSGGVLPVTPLTDSGLFKQYPVAAANGRFFFANRNYREYPGIYSLDADGNKKPKRLLKQAGINSLFYWEKENALVFSALEYFKSFYRYSGIYRLDIRSGKVTRLSRGSRLAYPVPVPDEDHRGDLIYCVRRVKNKSYLSVLDTGTKGSRCLSTGFESMAYLALSPDGRTIAASVKQAGKPWAIGLFSREGKLSRVVTAGFDTCYNPAWKSNRELFFICKHDNHYRLASVDIKRSQIKIYNDLPDIRYFSFYGQDRNKKLLISYLTANGYNLALADITKLKGTPAHPNESTLNKRFLGGPGGRFFKKAPLVAEGKKSTNKIKKYNPIRELLPKYITMYFRDGGGEYQPGLFVSGADLISRNAYSLGFYYGRESKTANIEAVYTYDGLFPNITLSYSDVTDLNSHVVHGRFSHRKQKLTLSALWPLRVRNRSQAYVYTGLHRETLTDEFPQLGQRDRLKLNGITTGIFINTAKQYYDSISASDGIHLSLSYSREMKALGSDFNINDGALQFKQYISLFRPNVLALRLAVADSWGDTRRVFYMGGAKSYNAFITAGNNLFELMRGYPSGYFPGTGGFLVNLEYRMSLLKIENVFLVFQSLERLYLSFFCDAGNLWEEKKRISPAYSLGMELNLTAYLGDINYIISLGAAVGQRPYHQPVFYIRLGTAF